MQARQRSLARRAVWTALMLAAGAANADESATELARSMVDAHRSSGFEARFRVWSMQAGVPQGPPSKFSVVGESATDGTRILVRAMAGTSSRPFAIAARADGSATVSVECPTSAPACTDVNADPFTAQPLAGLYLWDMLVPWWSWRDQTKQGVEQVDGRTCTSVISRAQDRASRVQSVTSCVDVRNMIALKTILRDARGAVIRRIDVEESMRQSSGRLVAKRLLISGPDQPTVRLEVYAGDEHYEIRAGTFSIPRPDAGPVKQEATP
jgi:hypothetical protein